MQVDSVYMYTSIDHATHDDGGVANLFESEAGPDERVVRPLVGHFTVGSQVRDDGDVAVAQVVARGLNNCNSEQVHLVRTFVSQAGTVSNVTWRK